MSANVCTFDIEKYVRTVMEWLWRLLPTGTIIFFSGNLWISNMYVYFIEEVTVKNEQQAQK